MFWGLIMEPQRRYTQQVKKAFHISMAALDISTSSDEPAQVMCGFEGRNYLLCTLRKPDMLQCSLDLNFDVGSEVSFAANGKCHVHLTGYLTDELLDTTEELEEEQSDKEISVTSKKRSKGALENGHTDSDDSDLDVNTLLEKSLSDSDDDDSDALGDEENEEDEDEEDEDIEEEESSLSEEETEEIVPNKQKSKANGVPKKTKNENKKEERDRRKKEDQIKQNVANTKIERKSPIKESQTSRKKTVQGGVIIEDLKEGQGNPAKNGKFVSVYYEGRLKQNNKVFDATTKGNGFSFRLGSGEVIKGWDVGVLGMKPGGKRRITCPPSMAYGQKGSPPAIPPNSTLVFEVELKKIS
ncbi:hypothetical protein NQ318_008278 [Aromia moschata]|uniref:peptidylprolyl isomerase n=1 Tax=Aromia moschata TaxID=1265417 RepID=A0AAV8XY07_9CUCU|nr:hypothetical protein NQ318_008278 [Aromia moschata]